MERVVGIFLTFDPSGFDYTQPVITTGSTHVRLWHGPSAEEVARILKRSVEQVFPIEWQARVPVDGETIGGVVNRTDVGAA